METNYHPEKCMYKECAYPFMTCLKCVANVKIKKESNLPKIDAHRNYKFVRKLFRHHRIQKQ